MHILTLFASPRKKGNTARILEWVESEFKIKGCSVERIDMNAQEVKCCISCYQCHKTDDKPGCAHKDDGAAILDKMIAADGIIYASPLYCWSWSAQIKPLIDRHFSLVKGYHTNDWISLLEGKKSGLVMTAGSGMENNAELAIQQYDNLSNYTKTDVRGRLVITNCSSPDAFGESVKAKAAEFVGEFFL